MSLFERKVEEPELTQEEKLDKLMKSQVENKESKLDKTPTGTADGRVEGYLVFRLVESMNMGNSGAFHGRPEMARRQIEELKNLGYDLNQIYNSIYDTKS